MAPQDDAATRLLAEARASRQEREGSYRGMALRMFPPICGRCGREFEGKRLRELTVHHKDGNHDNNPADGSNWELLCVYCHDNEHQREVEHGRMERALGKDPASPPARDTTPPLTQRPFAALQALLERKKREQGGT
jgi:hypothetical protein